ncbi:RHS repeat-associated core domain-containing protein [Consotaella aegiceratis]|uniref:RHS repeat-associated core domain-containing protein n=1 Tax=Consotaella aegiceratis TaxID=3097961 RepID=UPI002F4164C0
MLAVVTDPLGTPKEMFDARGHLVWAADHHVWGAVRAVEVRGALAMKPAHARAPDALACPWRFPGQYEDAETGLYYNRHRHYDPLTGHYTSPDPIGLAGGDRPQAYVQNPTVWVDPLGLAAAGGADNVTLYRVVSPQEARSIQATGQFTPSPGGLESKYFSSTEAGARQYGEMAKRLGETNQTIVVKGEINRSLLTPEMRATVDRGVDAIAVPNEILPNVKPIFLDPF